MINWKFKKLGEVQVTTDNNVPKTSWKW
jgi:hypothetical protein